MRRKGVIIRRALSWAMDLDDPKDFDTWAYILVPRGLLISGDEAKYHLTPEMDEGVSNVTVQVREVT